MNLSKCLRKVGLGKHQSTIMRALTREQGKDGLKGLDAAKAAVRQRLKELKGELSSINAQVASHQELGAGTRHDPVQASTAEHVAMAATRAAEAPSPGQIDAGNARKGHFEFAEGNPLRGLGMVSIETAAGVRRVAKDGSWSSPPMPFPYGHLQIAQGADGDRADITIGPNLSAPNAYVIDQINPEDSSYDESKSFVGFESEAAVRKAYLDSFSDDATGRIGAITEMPIEQFVRVAQADGLAEPIAYTGPETPELVQSTEEQVGELLTANQVTGRERLEILSKVRGGEYSLEDLREAYPEKPAPEEAAPLETTEPEKTEPLLSMATGDPVLGQNSVDAAEVTFARRERALAGGKVEGVSSATIGSMGNVLKDDSGRPLVLYHGTDSEMAGFSVDKVGSGGWSALGDVGRQNASMVGPAYYLTSSEDHAKQFGKNSIKFNASLSNPLTLDAKGELVKWRDDVSPEKPIEEFIAGYENIYQALDADAYFNEAIRNGKKAGNDGVVVDFGDLMERGTKGFRVGKVVILFDTKQAIPATQPGPPIESRGDSGKAPPLAEPKNQGPLFSRSDAILPEGFTVNEANREQTNALERFTKATQGHNFAITPVVLGQATAGTNGVHLRAMAELSEGLAGLFEKKVIWITADGPFKIGGITATTPELSGYIFVDARSNNPGHILVGHELTHHMAAETPAVYREMFIALHGLLQDYEKYRVTRNLPSDMGEIEAKAEMIGDLMGDNFAKREFWNDVARQNPGAFRAIARTVKGWLDRLIGLIKGKVGFGSEEFVYDVNKARRILAHALVEYALNRKTGSGATPSTGPQYSRGITLGALTPAQQQALTNVHGTPQTWQQKLNAFRADWKKRMVQGIFDQYAPILDYTQKGYRLARQSKGGDSTLEAMLLYGKPYVDQDGAYRVTYDRALGMQGFAKVIGGLKGEQDRFLEWVAAQRAERLKGIGLENLYSPQDIAALKTLNQGVMKDGGSRPAAYATALNQLNDWNDSILKIAVDSGLIDDATRQMYKDTPYVPFYRLQEEGVVTGFGMKAGLVNQHAWKKLKGGTEHLNADLLANLLQNWSHMITASAKNRAAKETLDAAARAGVAQQIPSGTPGKGLVHYMEAGKEKVFRVTDDNLVDAVAAMHYAGLGNVGKPFVTMKRWLTIGVTVNPAFKVRNLIRDSVQAIGTADLSYNPGKNIVQGFKATELESETRAQMLAGGGMIRFGSMLDGNSAARTRRLIEQGVNPAYILDSAGKIERFWKQHMLPAFDAYQELGDRGEQISRAALYEQLTAKGMSHEEASFWARDLMDFSLTGKWAAVRVLTQVVPFMNARLQGLYKIGRATKNDYKRMGAVLGAVALSSIALLLAYQDDEDWKRREDWDRDNNWWLKVGGVAFRIPKPFEIGAIGTLAERSVEYLISDEMTGKRFAERISATVFSQLSMNPTPQLMKPLMDIYANKDSFTGRPIETMGMDRLRKQDRSTERTSEIAKALGSLGLPDPTQLAMGKWNTLSPVQIDSLVRGYFGWLGASTTVALDWGIRPLMGRGERPDMKLRDVFFAGNFAETLPTNSSRYVTNLYDQAAEIEQAYGSWRDALKRGDAERAREISESEKGKIAKYHLIETIKRGEAKINAQIRQIEAADGLPGDEKRLRLDRLNQQKDGLARLLSVQ